SLDSDPLVDLRNLQAIWRVVKGGWVFDPLTSASLTRNSAQHIMLGRNRGRHEEAPEKIRDTLRTEPIEAGSQGVGPWPRGIAPRRTARSPDHRSRQQPRSEERRVGKECRAGGPRWARNGYAGSLGSGDG